MPLLPTTIRSALDLLGDVEDRVGGVALDAGGCSASTPACLAPPAAPLEDHVDVLARTDRVCDVAGDLAALLAHACAGTRARRR